ncbi:hypothetical protein MIR68_009545 [Amoeboaphelidium protococcarum]|nr:hypothetical protein MIR68_009545 [Amoeboaphelidium protococcarum]
MCAHGLRIIISARFTVSSSLFPIGNLYGQQIKDASLLTQAGVTNCNRSKNSEGFNISSPCCDTFQQKVEAKLGFNRKAQKSKCRHEKWNDFLAQESNTSLKNAVLIIFVVPVPALLIALSTKLGRHGAPVQVYLGWTMTPGLKLVSTDSALDTRYEAQESVLAAEYHPVMLEMQKLRTNPCQLALLSGSVNKAMLDVLQWQFQTRLQFFRSHQMVRGNIAFTIRQISSDGLDKELVDLVRSRSWKMLIFCLFIEDCTRLVELLAASLPGVNVSSKLSMVSWTLMRMKIWWTGLLTVQMVSWYALVHLGKASMLLGFRLSQCMVLTKTVFSFIQQSGRVGREIGGQSGECILIYSPDQTARIEKLNDGNRLGDKRNDGLAVQQPLHSAFAPSFSWCLGSAFEKLTEPALAVIVNLCYSAEELTQLDLPLLNLPLLTPPQTQYAQKRPACPSYAVAMPRSVGQVKPVLMRSSYVITTQIHSQNGAELELRERLGRYGAEVCGSCFGLCLDHGHNRCDPAYTLDITCFPSKESTDLDIEREVAHMYALLSQGIHQPALQPMPGEFAIPVPQTMAQTERCLLEKFVSDTLGYENVKIVTHAYQEAGDLKDRYAL